MFKLFKNKKIPKWVSVTGVALGAAIVLVGALSVYTYSKDTVFSGVTAGGVELSGMTEAEAAQALSKASDNRFDAVKITVSVDDVYSREVTAKELGVKFSSEETAKKALSVGREGGYFSRIITVLGTVFTDTELDISVSFDEASIEALVAEFSANNIVPENASYVVEGDVLTLYPKKDGKGVNAEAFVKELKERFEKGDYSELAITREVIPAAHLDMDKVYSEVHTEVADARLEKGDDGNNKIITHVVGVDFDIEAAKKKYEATPDEIIEIPLTLTQPEILTKHLETNLFKYKIVEVETYFSPKKVTRTANVRLAAQYVNGTILNPGEEFSYNKVVGPRTSARGFKEAAIFAQGEVVDGIGGGICQVSSTIYMAAIKSNMKITERRNHSFYVDYAPKGEDATVVYGSIDFKFVNTHKYPVKIVATSKNNYIRIAFMGTEPDEARTVKLTKTTHSTTAYSTREKTTDELPAGERQVEQKGQPGLSMTVYRNVYDADGKLVESYIENTSKYKPMTEIILVGTGGKTETTANTGAPETPTETETEAPAAEAPEAPTEAQPSPPEASTEKAETPPAEETEEPESSEEVPVDAEDTPAPSEDEQATPAEGETVTE